jgi:heme o synthase
LKLKGRILYDTSDRHLLRCKITELQRIAPYMETIHPIRSFLELTKPRITLLVLVVAYCGMVMAPGGSPPLELTFFTLLALALASSSSSALNNFVDRHIDVVMERTAGRSLPTGRVKPNQALVMGIIFGACSIVLMAWKVNLLTAGLSAFALLFYVFIYTIWLKRHTEHCTVIGGIAGALPPVMGLTAVTGEIGLTALVMFAILFVWQPPHFWALAMIKKEEYRKAGIPMLPVVKGEGSTKRQMLFYTIVLFPTALTPWFFDISGTLYLILAILMNLIYLGWTIIYVKRPFNPDSSRKLFLFSILYIAVIFTALLLDRQIQ